MSAAGGARSGRLFNLANVLSESGHGEAAVEAYRQAVELDPSYAAAWNNLGLELAASGKSDEAVNAWQKSVGVDPTLSDAVFNLADASIRRDASTSPGRFGERTFDSTAGASGGTRSFASIRPTHADEARGERPARTIDRKGNLNATQVALHRCFLVARVCYCGRVLDIRIFPIRYAPDRLRDARSQRWDNAYRPRSSGHPRGRRRIVAWNVRSGASSWAVRGPLLVSGVVKRTLVPFGWKQSCGLIPRRKAVAI